MDAHSIDARSSRAVRVVAARALLAAVFFAFLYPISANGISVNYSFVLFPLVLILLQSKLRYPGDMLILSMSVFFLIFICASLYQLDWLSDSGRRFVSFAIFMTMFSYVFSRIDREMMTAFKHAIIAISLFFSLFSIYVLLAAGAESVGFDAKNLVGSQRFGFIYLLAIWLISLDPQLKALLGVFKYPALLALVTGLLLTFSRSSIVAALASILLFSIFNLGDWIRHMSLRGIVRGILFAAAGCVLVFLSYRMFPLAFEFFDTTLFSFLTSSDRVTANLLDSTTSEGTRVFLAQKITEFVARNPLTGSGYLGVWMMQGLSTGSGVAIGSAHSQYFDVLLRTGVIGAFLYACIILSLLKYLWRDERALFWGMTGVLTYGLFHETFKESQGAFVLAFLLGSMVQSWRDRRSPTSPSSERETTPQPSP